MVSEVPKMIVLWNFVTKSKLKTNLAVWRNLSPYIFQGGLQPGSPSRRAAPGYAIKTNSRTIRSRLSQSTSAGEGGYLSELQAMGDGGAQFPGRRIIMGAPNHCWGRQMSAGAPKIPNNFTITFFSTVNFLPKDLTFENGGAKLASFPGRSPTSLHPCCKLITAWHYIYEPDSCAVWVSYWQKKRPLQE